MCQRTGKAILAQASFLVCYTFYVIFIIISEAA